MNSRKFVAVVGLLIVSMLLVGLVTAQNSAVQSQPKTQVEGVWKITEVVMPSTNPAEKGTSITTPQPGLIIFTKGYYSLIAVRAREPRAAFSPAKNPDNLTDAEKIARYEQWRPFSANAGTYDVKGSTLQLHPIVAKSVEVMTDGKPITFELKAESPTSLWLIPSGDRATTDPKLKFTKVE